MMLVMNGFIFSVHTLKEPQIVIGFVPLVLSRHAVIVRHAIITILQLVSLTFFTFFNMVYDNATWKQCNMQLTLGGTKYTRIFCMGIHNILNVRGIPNILGGCNIS